MNVDKLLDSLTQRPRPCKICANAELSRMVLRWLDRKADPQDDCMVPLETFATALRDEMERLPAKRLAPYLDAPSKQTLQRHVARCLRRDHKTGEPLDG